ncbi:MBOAT-domain-containing protein [Athelia psychrophila]|uniref:MBOAT-domain-containing protein n=1 Tax=Athelia psychrophila TaxID=1759441 RepID=A0A166DWA9_9AGAM|nr:MBOAT-domain-containing protein [Fibularhizoctonia sp. CBS 109695]
MDALFAPIASLAGAPLDQVKLITCLLVSYPLGSLFIRIPASQPHMKHLFSVVVTLIYLLPVLKMYSAFLQLLGSVLGTYLIAAFVKGPNMPWIVFGFTMGHLLINHIIRAHYNISYETFEITGPQMVLTMKLSTFAWNVWDGRRPAADLDKWQTEKRITEYPSLLEFLGFAFYFPGFLVGPYLDFKSYMSLIDESIYAGAAAPENGRKVPKGRKRVAYRKMATGLAFLALFVTMGGSWNFGVAVQDWFKQRGWLYRVAYFQACGIVERSKYYAIWTLTEGASILTGLGFTGYSASGVSLWTGAANVDIANIEFAPNFKVLLDSWNMKTNIWLRECVYKRVTPKGEKPGFKSSMTTFATSAVWHGVAGGYYLTFLLGGFMSTVSRLARHTLRPLAMAAPAPAAKPVYDALGVFTTVVALNYIAAPFMLLNVRDSLHAWHTLGYYGFVIIFGGLAFFYSPAGRAAAARAAVVDGNINGNGSAPVTPEAYAGVVPPFDSAAREWERRMVQ